MQYASKHLVPSHYLKHYGDPGLPVLLYRRRHREGAGQAQREQTCRRFRVLCGNERGLGEGFALPKTPPLFYILIVKMHEGSIGIARQVVEWSVVGNAF